MRKITRQEARQKAEEYATQLDDPIDVPDSEEEIERHLSESLTVINQEIGSHEELRAIEYDLALTLESESLPRVKMKHLDTDSKREAVQWGYWPFDMSWDELFEVLDELDSRPHIQFFEEARNEINAGLYEGMKPESMKESEEDG